MIRSLVLILLHAGAGNSTSKKTSPAQEPEGSVLLLQLLAWHSVGQGRSSAVKGKLQDARRGQGRRQGAGLPSWQRVKVGWLCSAAKSVTHSAPELCIL